jgi:hypothetical protein
LWRNFISSSLKSWAFAIWIFRGSFILSLWE